MINDTRGRCAADGQRHLYQLVFSTFQGEEERRAYMEQAEVRLITASGLDPSQHGIVWYRLPDDVPAGFYTMQAEMLTKQWCERWHAAQRILNPSLT